MQDPPQVQRFISQCIGASSPQRWCLAHHHGPQFRTRLNPEPTSVVKQAPATLLVRSVDTGAAAVGPIPRGQGH